MKIAFVFPGQGSQSVGMLDAWAESAVVQQAIAQASQSLGQDLAQLMAQGPAEALNLTTNTQPVMLASAVAMYQAWIQAGGPAPAVMAGHSLGEYSALTAAGALSLEQAVPLVRIRADAMPEQGATFHVFLPSLVQAAPHDPGRQQADAGFCGSQGAFDYSLGLVDERSEGFNSRTAAGQNPDLDGYRSRSANAKLGFQLNRAHRLEASVLANDVNSQYDSASTRDFGSCANRRRTASIPPIPGIDTSITTTSGRTRG